MQLHATPKHRTLLMGGQQHASLQQAHLQHSEQLDHLDQLDQLDQQQQHLQQQVAPFVLHPLGQQQSAQLQPQVQPNQVGHQLSQLSHLNHSNLSRNLHTNQLGLSASLNQQQQQHTNQLQMHLQLAGQQSNGRAGVFGAGDENELEVEPQHEQLRAARKRLLDAAGPLPAEGAASGCQAAGQEGQLFEQQQQQRVPLGKSKKIFSEEQSCDTGSNGQQSHTQSHSQQQHSQQQQSQQLHSFAARNQQNLYSVLLNDSTIKGEFIQL